MLMIGVPVLDVEISNGASLSLSSVELNGTTLYNSHLPLQDPSRTPLQTQTSESGRLASIALAGGVSELYLNSTNLLLPLNFCNFHAGGIVS